MSNTPEHTEQGRPCVIGMCPFLASPGSKYCQGHRTIMEAHDARHCQPAPASAPQCIHCGKPIYDNGTVYVHRRVETMNGQTLIVESQWCDDNNKKWIAETELTTDVIDTLSDEQLAEQHRRADAARAKVAARTHAAPASDEPQERDPLLLNDSDVEYLLSLKDRAKRGMNLIGGKWFYDFAQRVKRTIFEVNTLLRVNAELRQQLAVIEKDNSDLHGANARWQDENDALRQQRDTFDRQREYYRAQWKAEETLREQVESALEQMRQHLRLMVDGWKRAVTANQQLETELEQTREALEAERKNTLDVLIPQHKWEVQAVITRAKKAELCAKAWRELAEAQDKLCMAYRLGNHKSAGAAIDAIERAKKAIDKAEARALTGDKHECNQRRKGGDAYEITD